MAPKQRSKGRGKGDNDSKDKENDLEKTLVLPIKKRGMRISPRKFYNIKKDDDSDSGSAQSSMEEVEAQEERTLLIGDLTDTQESTQEAPMFEDDDDEVVGQGSQSKKGKRRKLNALEKTKEDEEKERIEELLAIFFEARPYFYDMSHNDYKNTVKKNGELYEFGLTIGLERE